MTLIGVIDFEGDTEMYDALKENIEIQDKKYLIFDEDGQKVWFMWGDY